MTHDRDSLAGNPLAGEWLSPFAMPPFAAIEPGHFTPAFQAALAAHDQDIAAIVQSPDPPTFRNTIEALERAGRFLDRVSGVFFNLAGAYTNDALQAIERDIAPVLARHSNAVYLNAALFGRVRAIWNERAEADLTAEQARVLERYHTSFIRSGAGLDEAAKRRFAEIGERLAVLATQFGQNVLADEAKGGITLDGADDLAGLPDFVVAAAAQAAADRGFAGKHVISLSRSSIEPFLQFSRRRDLREKAFGLWIARGRNGGASDNRAIVAEIVALRVELARLLGYETFAHFRLDDSMAKTPAAVRDFLHSVWGPARGRALEEERALQAIVEADGDTFAIAAWDWRYYAERRRKAEFDLDEGQIKPYLQLDGMIEAAFATAHALFGLTFEERPGLPVYHPDVRVFEVKDRAGRHVGLFLGDYFARPSKHSGAWMSGFRAQEKLSGDVRPVVVNVMNFSRAAQGPTLLSFDDARTLFHEFGHALHGLLSEMTYPKISGTRVTRDFVEFPSQLYEHWLEQKDILRKHAVHYRTGEPMSEALIDKVLAARQFNQGCATVEYLASALVDLDFHLVAGAPPADVLAFERESLAAVGMPGSIVMRHATTHFTHVFSGGYSSAYYSYLWSEILDADGFAAFEETGDIFDPATARRLYDYVYSAGGLRDPAEAYRKFRGRMPEAGAVLKQRGLSAADAA